MQIKQSLERMPSEIVLVKIYNSKVADVCVAASVYFVSIFIGSGVGVALYFNQSPLPPSLSPFSLPREGGWFVVYVGVWLGGWGSSASGGHLCVDGVCEAHVERVVVLHQGGLVVVEHQVLQAAVQVVGLSEAEAARCAVDHAVLHLTFDAVETERRRGQDRWLFSDLTANFSSVFSIISSSPTAQTG